MAGGVCRHAQGWPSRGRMPGHVGAGDQVGGHDRAYRPVGVRIRHGLRGNARDIDPGLGPYRGLAAAPHTLVIDDLRNSRECLRARMERNGWVANTAPRTRSDGRASDAVWNAGRASVDGPRAGRFAPAMDSNRIGWVCGLGCAPEGLAGSCLRLSLTSMRRRSAGPLRLGGHLAMGNQIGIR